MSTPSAIARNPPSMRTWLTAGPGLVLTLLAPKCPLCVAAYLAWLGLGSSVAQLAVPLMRPVGLALLIVAVAAHLLTRRSLRCCRDSSPANSRQARSSPAQSSALPPQARE
jgi:hypothetical protein